MSVKELLEKLGGLDVRVRADGGRLKISAPEGTLTEMLRGEIAGRKGEIIAFLAEAAGTRKSSSIVRVPREGRIPLSSAQRRLWFMDRMEGPGAAYNMPAAFKLTGRFDEAAFFKAVDAIVMRHETLRTAFPSEDGEPYQNIQGASRAPVAYDDLTALPHEEREAKALRSIKELTARPFDLSEGPLLRTHLIRTGEDERYLAFSISHIVSDGWSAGVFTREIEWLYEEHLCGRGAGLPELEVQYADYSAWERVELAEGKLMRQVEYWRETLAGAPPSLNLPADKARPAIQSSRGRTIGFAIGDDVRASLARISARSGSTMFMTLAAAYAVTMGRLSGQESVVIGVPAANRNTPELEGMIGLFANTLPLWIKLDGNPSFTTLLERARLAAIGMFENSEAPFESLVAALNPERDLSRNPIAQTLFALHKSPRHSMFPELNFPGVKSDTVEIENEHVRYDVETHMWETGGGIGGLLMYNTGIFNESTARRLAARYVMLAESIAADPEKRIYDYGLLTAEEITLVSDWGGTVSANPAGTVHGLFEKIAEQKPDAAAVISGDETVNYAQLNSRADALAVRLAAAGAGRGAAVGIFMERGAGMVAALLGALKSGAAYVPVDPSYPKERVEFMLADSGIRAVVTSAALASSLPAGDFSVVTMEGLSGAVAAEEDRPAEKISSDDLAYIIYTSGSTGKPKGVMVTHSNVVNFLSSMAEAPGISPEETALAVTTISFDIAALEIFLPLTSGARVVIASTGQARDAASLMALMEKHSVTFAQATPSTWRMLIEAGWNGGTGLKVLCGGEALSTELAAKLRARSGALWNMYGPTETTIWSSIYRVTDADMEGGVATQPVGKPIANTVMRILDAVLKPVPIGAAGELYIGGAGVAAGYKNRPELTAERFIPDPSGATGAKLYRTGDLARYLPSGDIEYLGRSDFQVKFRGHRIELGEVESAVASAPGVARAVVVVREDAPGDKRLVAYVTPSKAEHAEDAIKVAVKAKLPDYMAPSVYVFMDDLPLTPNGKVDRKALPAPRNKHRAPSADARPANDLERDMAAIWGRLLQKEDVSVTDNLFDIGAHSFLIVKAQAVIEKELGIRMETIEMFRNPTIRLLARRLGEASPGTATCATLDHSSTAEKSRGAIARQRALMKKIRGANG
ncbi:MAG: amino acid adenylation domain-containing protein [Nitrospinae bacterium]|nr:amino acid adenylation domain-containing protein [Nitrospinota bacterium]